MTLINKMQFITIIKTKNNQRRKTEKEYIYGFIYDFVKLLAQSQEEIK